jgi:hypothetical protein
MGRVVYSTTADAWTALNRAEIRILEIANRKVISLEGSSEDFSPRWSPVGRYIAALNLSNHRLRVYDLQLRSWKTGISTGLHRRQRFSEDRQAGTEILHESEAVTGVKRV